MPKKLKLIVHGLILIITAILLVALTTVILINKTVLKPNYIINTLNKTNHYNLLLEDIKEEMLYYTEQSGFNDDIIDDTFTKEEIKKALDEVIINAYHNKKTDIDTSKFKERLSKKIDDYITENNFKITDRKELDDFTTEMSKIYVSKIKLSGITDKVGSMITEVIKLLKKIEIILLIATIIMLLINLKFYQLKKISISLYTCSFLIIASIITVKYNIPINNIFIYNKLLSNVIKYTIYDMIKYLYIIATIYVLLGTTNIIIRKNKVKK